MPIYKKQLNTALSTIYKNKKGFFSSCQFVNLISDVNESKYHRLANCLRFIHQDIWNLETIVLRLAWQKKLWTQNKLNNGLWMQFAAADIDLFHVEFRSIFDYLAMVINTISDKPGEVPLSSFRKLRQWAAEPGNAKRLGTDLTKVVSSCVWFDDFRKTRDSIIHSGGFTIVFPKRGKILFQVHEGIDRKILIEEIMFNQNVADFQLYAGLYFGYLIAYLEEISKLTYKRLNLNTSGRDARSYHQGLQVLRDWIIRLLKCIDKNGR